MNKIARLTRDIPPWVLGWLLLMVALIAVIDLGWMQRPGLRGAPLAPGMMLFLTATLTAQKRALWRTLPVTERQIDQARWWQGVGLPGLLLLGLPMALAGMRLALGLRAPGIASIVLMGLAQSALGTLYAGAIFVAMPWAARHVGRAALLLAAPLALMPLLMIIGVNKGLLVTNVLAMLAGTGLAVAALLYATTGRWPEPMSAGMWSTPNSKSAARDQPGARGWAALIGAMMPSLLWCWGLAAALPLALHLLIPHIHAALFGWFVALAAMQIMIGGLAVAMRPLRALPLTGMALVLRLSLLLLAAQAISLAVYYGVLLAVGEKTSMMLLLVPMALPLVYFAAALRWGLKIIQYGYGLMILTTIPLQFIHDLARAAAWSVATALVLLATGLWWLGYEIMRGSRAWRVQPMQQQRFRGR